MRGASGREGPARSGWAAVLLLAFLAGCEGDSKSGPRAAAPESPSPAADEASPAAPAASKAPDIPREETWETAFIGGARVGYTHTVTEPVEEKGRTLRRIVSCSEMRLKRFGESVSQQLQLTSWETPDGRLVRCETRLAAGAQADVTRGVVDSDRGVLILERETAGKKLATSIPWRAEWGGFFGMEESLRRQPMARGQTRRLEALIPVFHQVGRIRLAAAGLETTQLLHERRRLLKIDSTILLAGQSIPSVVWVDQRGEILKSFMPGVGQTAYRTTRSEALAGAGQGEYDLGKASIVKVGRRLLHPQRLRRVVYRATLEGADPMTVFPGSARQQVRRVNERTVELDVVSSRSALAKPPEGAEASPPEPGDLAPNNLIQSDDPRVAAMARRAAPEETDPWKVAVALEGLVHRSMRNVNFSKTFATAAEVAQSLEGDCTEHAVLLAGLCRARKIPARVAIGLVYYAGGAEADQEGFAYHMWSEAWAGGRWRPLDATLGLGGIGATHLKLGDSNLQGADAYAAFLPVYQVLGRLKLEIVRVEEASPVEGSSQEGSVEPAGGASAGRPASSRPRPLAGLSARHRAAPPPGEGRLLRLAREAGRMDGLQRLSTGAGRA